MIDQLCLGFHQGLQVSDDGALEVLDPVPLEELDLHLDDLGDLDEVGLCFFQAVLPLGDVIVGHRKLVRPTSHLQPCLLLLLADHDLLESNETRTSNLSSSAAKSAKHVRNAKVISFIHNSALMTTLFP